MASRPPYGAGPFQGYLIGRHVTFEGMDLIIDLVYLESNRVPMLGLRNADGKTRVAAYTAVVVESEATK